MAVSEEFDVKQENANLKEIEEFIFDQDLIMTYKRLSKLLNVHVNEAKRLLALFVDRTRQGKRPVSVTYLVSGKVASENAPAGSWRVLVIPEDQLEATKKEFLSDSISEHVYSVHQGTKVVDTGALVMANKAEDNGTRNAAIINKIAKPRDEEKMQQLVQKATVSTSKPESVKPATSKPAPAKPVPSKKPSEDSTSKSEDAKQSEESKKESTAKQATGTIGSMFAAQTAKSADSNNKPVSKPAGNNKGGKKTNSGGNIASFFQRQNSAPPMAKSQKVEKAESKDTSPTSDSKASDNSQTDSQGDTKSSKTKEDSKPVVNGKTKKASSAKPSKASNKRKNKAAAEAPKKRKRIMAVSDSDSSGDEDSAPEEILEVDSPPPPVSHVQESDEEVVEMKETPESSQTSVTSSYTERRLVDKVFKDDKGFIVTKKEWVVEKHTEEVSVTEEKKTKISKDEPTESKAAPVKRKQADIMSFFGRK